MAIGRRRQEESIGPEACTTVLTSSMINWLGDRMRWATLMRQKVSLWCGKMQTQDLARAPRFSQLLKVNINEFSVILGLVGDWNNRHGDCVQTFS